MYLAESAQIESSLKNTVKGDKILYSLYDMCKMDVEKLENMIFSLDHKT